MASGLYLSDQGDILATAVPGFPVWDLGGLLGSTLWAVWLLVLGVLLLRRPAGVVAGPAAGNAAAVPAAPSGLAAGG